MMDVLMLELTPIYFLNLMIFKMCHVKIRSHYR